MSKRALETGREQKCRVHPLAAVRELVRRGREGRASLSPWLALWLVWLLFELPAALHSTVPDLSAVRFALELPLLLTLWGLEQTILPRLALRVALRCAVACLLLLRIDTWICLLLMHDEPLLYDQWFMLRHLGVLIGDLMSWVTALVLLGVGLGSWLLSRLVGALLRHARALFAPARRARTAKLAVIAWCGLLSASVSLRAHPDPVLAWLTPALVRNITTSRAVYRSVQQQAQRSIYADYDRLTLRDRPDLLLFIVESYGRLLSVEPSMRAAHAELLAELSRELTQAGWHAASTFSTSTVSGGRSWLAEGTMLMGTPIRYEAVFQHLVSERPESLVGFLNRQGYETVLLAPADRNRPGAYVVNRYGFARVVTYEELGYPGPAIGWGIVPDQYSLAFAEQRLLRDRERPVFLDFHMVSSHAPWHDVPVLTDDIQAPAASSAKVIEHGSGAHTVLKRLERYERGSERRFAYMDQLDATMRAGYQATISYDLRLISQYLARRREDALVVLIGDHQPPVIARSDVSFDAPIHVLSRNPARLSELLRQGFVSGLALAPSAPPTLTHAGLFSLLVRALAAHSCAECTPPPLRPEGAPLVAP